MSFVDFSSWPRDQEQSFIVYEQQQSESRKKALTIGAIAGAVCFVLLVGIYAGVKPDHKDITKDMNMGNLTKRSKKAEVAPAAAPKEEAKPAEPAAPAAAPAEEKAEAKKE